MLLYSILACLGLTTYSCVKMQDGCYFNHRHNHRIATLPTVDTTITILILLCEFAFCCYPSLQSSSWSMYSVGAFHISYVHIIQFASQRRRNFAPRRILATAAAPQQLASSMSVRSATTFSPKVHLVRHRVPIDIP